MSTVGNVSAGKPSTNGAIFVAPSGTTKPTTASETLDSAFKALGFVSEDGVVNSNSKESDNVKAWGGQVVLTTSSENNDTFKLKLIEAMNADVLKAVYGSSNVTEGTGTISVTATATEAVEAIWVIDIAMTGNSLKRIVIPCGKITELGDITYKDDEAIGYEITISALPDSSGNNHYEYIKIGGTSGSGTS